MADRTLISGAGKVAQSKHSGALSAAKAGMVVGEHLSEGIGKIVQKRNREFNKLMEAELEAAGELSTEEYDELFKDLQKKRGGYVYLNKRGRIRAEEDLNKQIDGILKNKEQKQDVVGNLPDNLPPDQQDWWTDFLKNPPPTETDEDGNVKFRVEDSKADEERKKYITYKKNEETGKIEESLASYQGAWDEGFGTFKTLDANGNEIDKKSRWTKEVINGVEYKVDEWGNKYENNEKGLAEFKRQSKKYWQERSGAKLDVKDGELIGLKSGIYDGKDGAPDDPLLQDSQRAGQKDEEEFFTPQERLMTIAEIYDDRVKDKGLEFDAASKEKLDAVVTNMQTSATATDAGEFNEQGTKDQISSILNGDEVNLISLATSNKFMPGNSSWRDDMYTALTDPDKGFSYENLGISQQKVESEDPTPNTPITDVDARIIINKIMEDENLLQETLTDYFTMRSRDIYNNAKGGNAPSDAGGGSSYPIDINKYN
tara:strand:+ start:1061 stop:2515 length:1455 start_codon:yes stop_codon:yes gene_type:complete